MAAFFPASFEELIDAFASLPGIGRKSAQRLAFYVLALPEGEAESRLMTPPYADFDVNGHVNNTKYLDWACSALGHGAMASRRVTAFTVSYEGEILPGTDVRTELIRNGDQFAFCGFAGERRCFAGGGMLAPRND